MKILYEYTFGDGLVVQFEQELTFAVFKLAVDIHNGLVKCKKIVVMEVE